MRFTVCIHFIAFLMQYYVISISTCHLKPPCKHHFNGCVIIHHMNVPSFPFSLLSLLSVLPSACWQLAWIQTEDTPLPRTPKAGPLCASPHLALGRGLGPRGWPGSLADGVSTRGPGAWPPDAILGSCPAPQNPSPTGQSRGLCWQGHLGFMGEDTPRRP